MQTFLPFQDFEMSARVLDNKRLGKQRVECLQILKALTEENYGWKNHPAVKMWQGHVSALALYGLKICEEWKHRGYKDTCADKIRPYLSYDQTVGITYPKWLDGKFCMNHRSILLGKAMEAYLNSTTQRARDKARDVLIEYSSWFPHDVPAVRNENGKWPYVWPRSE